MKQTLKIYEKLPSLNELIDMAKKNRYSCGKWTKEWHNTICKYIIASRLKKMDQAKFDFIWIETDKGQGRDKDNISSLGKKFIFDALVKARILKDDGWDDVISWSDHFTKKQIQDFPNGGVIVYMDDICDDVHVFNVKSKLVELIVK